MSAQGLAGGAPSPADAVRRLVAVQAQDVVAPLVAIAARTATVPVRAEVEAAFAGGGPLVRTWTMRGTLHVVAAEDVGWLLALTGGRMLRAARAVRARDGVGDRELAQAASAVASMPAEGLRRPDLLAAFAAAGADPGGSRGYHLIVALAAQGLLHIGARDGTQYRFHRSAGALPAAPGLDEDQAVARLATRFIGGHGPATAEDLAKWAGLPVTAARRGIAAAGDALEAVDLDGAPAWIGAGAADPAPPGSVHALPAFDELIVGYADRRPVLRDLPLGAVAPGTNGRFLPAIVADGRLVGTWDPRATPAVTPLVHLGPTVLERAEAAARAWATWIAG